MFTAARISIKYKESNLDPINKNKNSFIRFVFDYQMNETY